MRTALSRGLRPTTLINRVQPRSRWTEIDFLLLEAEQIAEQETSHSTGLPTWITRTLSEEVGFQIEDGIDIADRELELWDEKHKEDTVKGRYREAVPYDLLTDKPVELSGWTREQLLKADAATMASIQTGDPDLDVEIEILRPGEQYDPRDYGDG